MAMATERRVPLRWREEWSLAIMVLLGALAIRVVLGVSLGPSVPIADDQRDYLSLAHHLALTRQFGHAAPAPPTAFRDPAYPAFLALLGGGSPLRRIWIAQVLLSGATGMLVVLA